MNNERFNIVFESISNIPTDKWVSGSFYNGTSRIEYYSIKLTEYGDLMVDDIKQHLTWTQRRKFRKFYFNMEAEIATRRIQRQCDI